MKPQARQLLAPELGAPPAPDPIGGIGVRLAALRERQGRKMSVLAREAGVSPSLVSQIERGQSRPSVSTLFALAEALGVPVDAFFRDGDGDGDSDGDGTAGGRAAVAAPVPALRDVATAVPEPARGRPVSAHRFVVYHGERAAIEIEGGVRWERLTPGALPNVEFLELVYAPGAESNPDLYRHPGTEMVVVIHGRLDIHVGFDRYELHAGDSIQFPSALPHRYVNPTSTSTRAITVILLDLELDQSTNPRRP